ncbi:MAG: TIGR02147 family protein [Bdellovibrionaceae bacterium]|nr:TIGR02147 family protein [Pseudobdellovibrionaceae bacterium]
MSLFNYEDYKSYLKALVRQRSKERGFKSFLAKASGCERSYLSQILNGKAHLTSDQAFSLSGGLGFDDSERTYWMVLVELSRAATQSYKRNLISRLRDLQIQHDDLKNRFKNPPRLQSENEMAYFSRWYMVAVHLLTGVYKDKQLGKITKDLNLSEEVVSYALTELEEMGLLKKEGILFKPTKDVLYVHKSSPLCDIHHINWRQQAISDVQKRKEESLHLTAVHSLSMKDFQKIKQILLDSIKKGMEVSQQSQEEVLACLNIDYFHF